jgi:hypothetical protein
MKLGPVMLTRDSLLWSVSAVLSLAAFLGTLQHGAVTDPLSFAYYGIPDRVVPYIRLLAFVNVWFSGKMAHSPLKSKAALEQSGGS